MVTLGGWYAVVDNFSNVSVSPVFPRREYIRLLILRTASILTRCLRADGASLVSFGSEEPTPTKYHYVPRSPRDDAASNAALPWRPVGWSRVVDTSVPTVVDNPVLEAGGGGRKVADVTTRIYSSSSSCTTEHSTERVVTRRHQGKRHHRHTDSAADHERRTDRRRRQRHPTPERDHETAATVALLTNELVIVRSQIEQKDVVVRSLQRQLDQVS